MSFLNKKIDNKIVFSLIITVAIITIYIIASYKTSPKYRFVSYFSCRTKGQPAYIGQKCCNGLIHYTRGLGRSVNFCEKPGLLVD